MVNENKLFIPSTAKELLCLDSSTFENDPNYTMKLCFINQSIVDWLNGRLDTGTLSDILLEHEINPSLVIDKFEDYIYYLIKNNI